MNTTTEQATTRTKITFGRTFHIKNAKVKMYALDAPFKERTATYDAKGFCTNGKMSIAVELDVNADATKALLADLKGNVSIKKATSDDNTVYVQVNASTPFKPKVADENGNEIDAPTDVRTNRGDVMIASLSVREKFYDTPQGTRASSLDLVAAKIISHDKTNRIPSENEGKSTAELFAALDDVPTNLAALKG